MALLLLLLSGMKGLCDGCRVRIRRMTGREPGPVLAEGVLVGGFLAGRALMVAVIDSNTRFVTSCIVGVRPTAPNHYYAETRNSLYSCELVEPWTDTKWPKETTPPLRFQSELH